MLVKFEWVVVGAGPAGIAAIGKLLDFGVSPNKIAWIDPEFKVGDFGSKWRKVPSNTKVNLFLKFFQSCQSFDYELAQNNFLINKLDPETTCLLEVASEPLLWITNRLKNKVFSIVDKLLHIKFCNGDWELSLSQEKIKAKKIILAIGSEPKSLSLSQIETISLDIALDSDELQKSCHKNDVIGVFGSSHSAVLILKTLLENFGVKKIINFYLSPLQYAIYTNDSILFDDNGLKGIASQWAKENLDKNVNPLLERILATTENIKSTLPLCNKIIYATGFHKRFIHIEGLDNLEHNPTTGIIMPGLFGLGIAFPEQRIDHEGKLQNRVGLWKFMDYLNRVLPQWMLDN